MTTLAPNLSILTPYDEGRYQWRVCQRLGCNNVYRANIAHCSDLCPDCDEEINDHAETKRKNARAQYEKRRGWNVSNRRKSRWIIRYDPLAIEEGGLEEGVNFETLDFVTSLAMGSWSGGLVAEFEGVQYIVICQGTLERADGVRYGVYNGQLKQVSKKEV
jgi:hypothetical protein